MGDPVAHARVVALVGSFGSDGLQCGPLASLENVLSLVAIIFSVFFAIFVGSMASDQVRALGRGGGHARWFSPVTCTCVSQWEGIVTNTTGIEALKMWDEEEVCSRDVSGVPCGWFSPARWCRFRCGRGWCKRSENPSAPTGSYPQPCQLKLSTTTLLTTTQMHLIPGTLS